MWFIETPVFFFFNENAQLYIGVFVHVYICIYIIEIYKYIGVCDCVQWPDLSTEILICVSVITVGSVVYCNLNTDLCWCIVILATSLDKGSYTSSHWVPTGIHTMRNVNFRRIIFKLNSKHSDFLFNQCCFLCDWYVPVLILYKYR